MADEGCAEKDSSQLLDGPSGERRTGKTSHARGGGGVAGPAWAAAPPGEARCSIITMLTPRRNLVTGPTARPSTAGIPTKGTSSWDDTCSEGSHPSQLTRAPVEGGGGCESVGRPSEAARDGQAGRQAGRQKGLREQVEATTTACSLAWLLLGGLAVLPSWEAYPDLKAFQACRCEWAGG